MLLNINEIKIGSNRRKSAPENVKALSESISEVGMMNPITVDADNNLVAGLHRLEAAKLLGWTEIDCNVRELDELHAELAEIDENVIRTGLSDLELSELLARRKRIYETLHPETRHGGDRKSETIKSSICRDDPVKSFAEDTAEKMGVSPRTVERHVQIAENLTPEAKDVLRNADRKITKQKMMILSRMKPEEQKEEAKKLVNGTIQPSKEYDASSFVNEVTALKSTGRDFSCTPESFVMEVSCCLKKIVEELRWVEIPYYQSVFSSLSQEQLSTIENEVNTVHAALDNLIQEIKSTQAEIPGEADLERTSDIASTDVAKEAS